MIDGRGSRRNLLGKESSPIGTDASLFRNCRLLATRILGAENGPRWAISGSACDFGAHNISLKLTPEVRIWLEKGPFGDRLDSFAMGDSAGQLSSALCPTSGRIYARKK